MRKEERLERKKNIRHFRDLEVYRWTFDAAMQIFEITERFPPYVPTWRKDGGKGFIWLSSKIKLQIQWK
jgi:hypothetical protein